MLALIVALPIELLNFRFLGLASLPNAASLSWFEIDLAKECVIVHSPGIYLAYVLHLSGHLESVTWLLIGYIDTVIFIYLLMLLARRYLRMVKP